MRSKIGLSLFTLYTLYFKTFLKMIIFISKEKNQLGYCRGLYPQQNVLGKTSFHESNSFLVPTGDSNQKEAAPCPSPHSIQQARPGARLPLFPSQPGGRGKEGEGEGEGGAGRERRVGKVTRDTGCGAGEAGRAVRGCGVSRSGREGDGKDQEGG